MMSCCVDLRILSYSQSQSQISNSESPFYKDLIHLMWEFCMWLFSSNTNNHKLKSPLINTADNSSPLLSHILSLLRLYDMVGLPYMLTGSLTLTQYCVSRSRFEVGNLTLSEVSYNLT